MNLDQSEESIFEVALNRYKAGSSAEDLIEDFQNSKIIHKIAFFPNI